MLHVIVAVAAAVVACAARRSARSVGARSPAVIAGTIGLVDVVSPLRRLLPKTELHVRVM